MAIDLFTLGIVLLSVLCIGVMCFKFFKQPAESLSWLLYGKLVISGIIAFIADTLGVGSFAVNVALAKLFGTFNDEELPAVNNGAQVIPGPLNPYFLCTWLM